MLVERDRPVEIEITPEMIEAGKRAFIRYDERVSDIDGGVRNIIEAALFAGGYLDDVNN